MEKSKVLVLLDNGHGINTPGKCSVDKSLAEWKYAREIVKGIIEQLQKEGYSCYNVHPEDEEFKSQSYDLKLRTDRANAKHAEMKKQGKTSLFVSVHVNAAGSCAGWQNASGWTGWVAKSASSNSKKLAQILYAECEKRNLKGNRSVPKEKYWVADFWVVRKTNMPAVLTENLFMDNKEDVKFLLSEEGKKQIIGLHVQGIKKYIEQL